MFFRYLLHQWQKKEPCRETFICQGATFSGKTPTMLKCLMVGRSYKVTTLGLRRCLYSSKRPPEDNCLTITRLIFYFLTFFFLIVLISSCTFHKDHFLCSMAQFWDYVQDHFLFALYKWKLFILSIIFWNHSVSFIC